MEILDFSTFIFDLDGVIINSEFLHYECYKESLKNNNNYELTWNEYCKIHHSLDYSFEEKFPENYKKMYYEKNNLYKNIINEVSLIAGFELFFNLLIKYGKNICIVTDASDEIFNLICLKYPFLKKSNYIITRNQVNKRKPDSSCYLTLLNKLSDDIENHEIIAFEDSYKGWTSANNAIYNCVLVNNETYVYYETINAQNSIYDFENIINQEQMQKCLESILYIEGNPEIEFFVLNKDETKISYKKFTNNL
jgi:beta-phosphoglucomutase-like phosphatase (HAD superfamily)